MHRMQVALIILIMDLIFFGPVGHVCHHESVIWEARNAMPVYVPGPSGQDMTCVRKRPLCLVPLHP